ncbi:MAG: DUF1573 domain-containing protein [Muribaculaceae bacterium]|nr:DUF1573 domain-containing protein [Muribaculaceae bacterium]
MITKTVSKSIKSFQYNQNYPPQAFSLSYFSYLCSVNQRYHISLIFFTLLLTACIGGNRVSEALQTADKLIFVAPDSAVIMLDSIHAHQLGLINAHETITKDFYFENHDTISYTLQAVIPSCNCISATTDFTALSPGECGNVILTYNA